MSIIGRIGLTLILVLGVLAVIVTRRIFPDSTRREP